MEIPLHIQVWELMKLVCAVEQPKEIEAAMRGLTSDMRDGRIMVGGE